MDVELLGAFECEGHFVTDHQGLMGEERYPVRREIIEDDLPTGKLRVPGVTGDFNIRLHLLELESWLIPLPLEFSRLCGLSDAAAGGLP